MTLRDWVADQHKGQWVKDTYLPYMHHLDFVAETCRDLVYLGYETGLCHDLLEKTKTTTEQLRAAFADFGYAPADSEVIVSNVTELTDVFTKTAYPKLRKKERKQLEDKRLIATGLNIQTVKYADLLYNIRWVLAHETRTTARKYLRRKHDLLLGMTEGNTILRKAALTLANSI